MNILMKYGEKVEIKGRIYQVGKLFDDNQKAFNENDVQPIFDNGSNNFHFVLKNENYEMEILKEISNCIEKVFEVLSVIKRDNSVMFMKNNGVNKNGEPDLRYGGVLVKQGEKRKKYGYLFRYILAQSESGICYELNFMRFWVNNNQGNEVNCILKSIQFDRTYTKYVNADGICYPNTPDQQSAELNTLIEAHTNKQKKNNFCYNPSADFNDCEEIAKQFIEFIEKCEAYQREKSV